MSKTFNLHVNKLNAYNFLYKIYICRGESYWGQVVYFLTGMHTTMSFVNLWVDAGWYALDLDLYVQAWAFNIAYTQRKLKKKKLTLSAVLLYSLMELFLLHECIAMWRCSISACLEDVALACQPPCSWLPLFGYVLFSIFRLQVIAHI